MRQSINDPKQIMLLDGYNVIHRLPELAKTGAQTLEQRRDALARFVVRWKNERKYKGSVYLVFDGNDAQTRTLEQSILHGIQCIYSRQKEEADGKIISIMRNAEHPENITVISDDNYIANHVRSFGAYIKPVAYLAQSKKKRVVRGKHDVSKRIDPATAHHITDQMKKVWGISEDN